MGVVVSGGTEMLVAHAIIASGGLTALLVAASGLVIAAIVVLVSGVVQHRQHVAEPGAVPIWWDKAPAPGLGVPSEPHSTV
jgi:hypothetical protein